MLVIASAFAIASACGGSGGSVKAFCRTVTQGENPLAIFDRYDPADPAAARSTLQAGVARMEQMRSAAPRGEIRDSLATLISVAQKLSSALEQRASNASSAQVPDFSSEADQVAKASSTVTRFASDRCGAQLDSNVSGSSSPAPTSSSPAPSSS